jgi:membrane fusion protein (multidrug efflux system)
MTTIPLRRSFAGLALALGAAALLLPAVSCRKKEGPATLPPPVVEVLTLTTTNVPLEAEIIGQLDSPQNVEIRARVEAFVEAMPFVEGTEVKQDELLFKLDDRPYKQRLAAAKGSLGEAEASLKKYETDVARLRPLAEKKAVPQQDLDNALASVDVGRAAVFSAQAQVESAELDLSYCEVRAPTNGLIGAKLVSIGELVGKGQPTLMATMSTLDPIWFYCNVSEVNLLKADAEAKRTGKRVADAPATLIRADGSVHPATGKIVFLDRAADVRTGTLRLRAEFPNPESRPGYRVLRPGMFGRMKLDLGIRPDSILVPERAVTELQGRSFVWIIGPDNKAEQRAVTVGQRIGGSLLILEHLKAGERIVVEGLQKVRSGAEVKPITAVQWAEAAAAQAAPHAAAKAVESAPTTRQTESTPAPGTSAVVAPAAPASTSVPVAITNAASAVAGRPTELRLQKIVYRLGTPTAVINGETLRVGDSIAGSRVTEIQRQAVTLRRGETDLVLELPPRGDTAQPGKE